MSNSSTSNRHPGRVTLLDGTLYYSPNCSQDVSLPPPNLNNRQVTNVFNLRRSRLWHFYQPRWWTAAFGWLAFLPLQPSFTGFPFDHLVHVSRKITRFGGGFKLDDAVIESWARLQDYLSKATTIFIGQYQAPALRPFYPLAYQFQHMYPDHSTIRVCAELARDWFVVWMALLSYLFAVSKTNRTPVLKCNRKATLKHYKSTQKCYDPIFNKWDCCKEFGPADESSGEDSSDVEIEDDKDFFGANKPFSLPPRALQRSPSPLPIIFAPPEDMPTNKLLEVLSSHFGFVLPIPLPSGSITPPDEKSRTTFLHIFGMDEDRDSFFTTPVCKTAMAFVSSLALNKHPDVLSWDLSHHNFLALAGSPRLKFLRRLGPSHYMFDFEDLATVPWKLVVTNAADALHVCRLDQRWNDYEIAQHLLRHRIHMHTVLPLRDVPTSTSPDTIIPIRCSGYKFTRKDYDVYVRKRDAFAETLSIDEVLSGPSLATTVYRNGLSLPHTTPGQSLYDDNLTKEELYLICGTYICKTGYGQQTSIRLWWPLHSTYELVKTGQNYGRWTELSEVEHRKWLARIEGGAQPRTANEWQDHLRGRIEVRRMKDAIRLFSEAFIEATLQGSGGL